MSSKKIGITTVHRNVNYGANLQAFASCKFINNSGYNAEIIDYLSKELDKDNYLLSWLKHSYDCGKSNSLLHNLKLSSALALSAPTKYRRLKKFYSFREKYCKLSKKYENITEIENSNYDTIVCGSDQIWNPDITNGIDPIFFGDVGGVSKRISYAASVGKAEYSLLEAQKAIPLIKQLDYCSVREPDSAKYLSELANRNIETVCDPVFLLDKFDYEDLLKKRIIKRDYVLVYSIISNSAMLETAKKYAKDHKLNLVEICANKGRHQKHTQKTDYGPIEFLNAIKYANTIFTNSFHGTAFSIIFEKSFFVFNNKHRGSRITNLMKKAGLGDYMLDEENPSFPIESIDYSVVKGNLENFISSSKSFLLTALKSNKTLLCNHGCTGCGVCKTACKKDAIRITKDDKGFLKSYIDNEKCVNCKACYNICPAINTPAQYQPTSTYAFKAPDILRKNSTSGGAFAALATTVIDNGGSVYGASLDHNFKLYHKRIEKKEDIVLLQGTKYIQSDITGVFEPLKNDILAGIPVLFSGTPCQIAAINNFVKKEELNTEQLYLCDIICHGVPSPKVFDDYIKWLNTKHVFKKYFFRNKAISWRGDSSAIEAADAQLLHNQNTSAFMNIYYSNNITSDACFECKYTNQKRISDITISDFWGLENINPNFEDSYGVSMVLTNTQKGENLFAQTEGIKETSDIRFAKQPQLEHPTAKPGTYEAFWKNYKTNGFEYVVKHFGFPKKTVKTILYNLIKRK